MGKIRMLTDGMIGKIAAGEVVERPASAIKELVENSIDAGATAVAAEIKEGGMALIRVTDNGCGIDESDIRMAFERHATSKISQEKDLYSIQTLGFRGEALASISAVSHFVMVTRTADRDTGLKVVNEGGRILSVAETACTTGTSVIVTDLFFNTPVRKGFMKKPATEAGAVRDVMIQFILSRPDVSFRLISDGKTVFHSPGDGTLEAAVYTVFGGTALKSMRKVSGHESGLILTGYVGIGDNARGNRSQEYFFVNGRMMHSPVLSEAVEAACRERVMIGKFPVCALHVQIAYEAVDVNVHPNKLEVRFRDEKAVSEAVTTLVLEALRDKDAFEKPVEMTLAPTKGPGMAGKDAGEKDPGAEVGKEALSEGIQKSHAAMVSVVATLPKTDVDATDAPKPSPVLAERGTAGFMTGEPVMPRAATGSSNTSGSGAEALPTQTIGTDKPGAKSPTEKVTEQAAQPRPNPAFSSVQPAEKAEQVDTILPEIRKTMKLMGVLFNTFILVEYDDKLLMIDQHAVHERLLFDKLMREHGEATPGQELLVPMILSVTPGEMELIEENREVLASVGLGIERFGEREAAIRTIPHVLGQPETLSCVRDILRDLESGKRLIYEKKREMLLQTACKHAVKGGEALSEDQIRDLIERMIREKVTPTCPHGRPLVVAISHRELDKKFKRIQD